MHVEGGMLALTPLTGPTGIDELLRVIWVAIVGVLLALAFVAVLTEIGRNMPVHQYVFRQFPSPTCGEGNLQGVLIVGAVL